MEIILNSFTLLLVLAAATTTVAAALAAQRWRATGAPAVVASMAAGTWWALSYVLLLQQSPPSPRFWLTATFVGVVFTPPAFLIFTLLFTERGKWVNRRTLALLAIQPLVVLPILFTDSQHHLFFGDPGIDGGQPLVGSTVFWLNALYSYAINLWAFILLVGAHRRAPTLLRGQTRILLAGALTPTLLNLLSLLVLIPVAGLDATPIGFAFTGMAMVYNLRNYGLLDLVPVARHEVVNRMSDGVMVLDPEARLIDINPAATGLLQFKQPTAVTGRSILDTLADSMLARQLTALAPDTPTQLSVGGSDPRTLDVRAAEVHTEKTREPARLIVLRDVTEHRRAEIALRRQLAENEALQKQLRHEAVRDPLTSLYNRRFLEETLHRELSRAERGGRNLALALLDIDRFKNFNDRFGHEHGDRILRLLGDLLQDHARSGDVACRFGGEEFVMVFPEAAAAVAVERMDQIREAFAAIPLEAGDENVHATFSAGIAAYPAHGATAAALLRSADRALYAAKAGGRNRVLAADCDDAATG